LRQHPRCGLSPPPRRWPSCRDKTRAHDGRRHRPSLDQTISGTVPSSPFSTDRPPGPPPRRPRSANRKAVEPREPTGCRAAPGTGDRPPATSRPSDGPRHGGRRVRVGAASARHGGGCARRGLAAAADPTRPRPDAPRPHRACGRRRPRRARDRRGPRHNTHRPIGRPPPRGRVLGSAAKTPLDAAGSVWPPAASVIPTTATRMPPPGADQRRHQTCDAAGSVDPLTRTRGLWAVARAAGRPTSSTRWSPKTRSTCVPGEEPSRRSRTEAPTGSSSATVETPKDACGGRLHAVTAVLVDVACGRRRGNGRHHLRKRTARGCLRHELRPQTSPCSGSAPARRAAHCGGVSGMARMAGHCRRRRRLRRGLGGHL